MNKLFTLAAVLFGLFASSSVVANQCGPECAPRMERAREECAEEPTGECWCKFVTYRPQYYCVPRCVEEKIPCKKTCCRYVKQYYEVERCRYVPQYYKETYCRDVPQYYEVEDCKTCQRWVQDRKCRYIPEYYWKKVCNNNVGSNTGCGPTGCAR